MFEIVPIGYAVTVLLFPSSTSILLFLRTRTPTYDGKRVQARWIVKTVIDVSVVRPEVDFSSIGELDGMRMRSDLHEGAIVAFYASVHASSWVNKND